MAEQENEEYSLKENEIRGVIENTKLSFCQESINKKCYQHMIGRMKEELLQMKIATNKLEDGIKKRVALLENEKLEYNKVKVEKYRAQLGLDEIANNVELDKKKTEAKVMQLSKQINEKTEAVARRIQRLQRRQNIKDAARSDQTDQNEKKIRDKLLVHKFWNAFLRKRMEREIQNNSETADAFEKIRTSTVCIAIINRQGLEDFQEIVKKFLSRENTYSQLLEAVTDAEKTKEQLKLENEKLVLELKDKTIELDGMAGKDEESTIYSLQKEIANFGREEQNLLDKYQKCCIVHDQLKNWVLKMYRVMLSVLERSDKHTAELNELRSLDLSSAEQMFVKMCGMLEKFIETYGHLKEGTITVKALTGQDEFYNDETYQQRNVRVVPTRKKSFKKDESNRSITGTPATTGPAPVGNEIEKDQRDINSEFRDDRKKKRAEIKKIVILSHAYLCLANGK